MPSSEVLHKWKHGQLHSGSKTGPKVKSRAQAIAIMLSEKRAEAANGGKYPERAYGGPLMGSLGVAPDMGSDYSTMPTLPTQMAAPFNPMQSLPPGMPMGAPTGVAPSMPPQAYGRGLTGGALPPAGTMPTPPTLPAQASPNAINAMQNNFAGGSMPTPGAVSSPAMPTLPTLPPQASPRATNAMQGHFAGQGLASGGIAGGVGDFNMAKQAHTSPSYTEKSEMRSVMHGPVMSAVPGRTDAHKTAVPSGSYVVPADVVSGRGQGNTLAGMNTLQKLFKMGPYGSGAGSIKMGHTMPKPSHAPSLPGPRIPTAAAGGVQDANNGIGTPVPVNLAGGELIVPPENLQAIVHPDLEQAHSIMDKWVLHERKKHIKTLSKLPGPVKD